MSSMRNAAPRRPHRERSQPQARAKWGLLEKHKDYSLRAADFNQKKKKLNILSQKSRERHPDEFAFGMLSSDKAKAGKHGRGDELKNRLDHKVVQGLKEQDSGHLRTMLSRTRREIERVREDIGLDGVMKKGTAGVGEEKKTYFDADGEPVRKRRKVEVEDEWSDEQGSASDDEDDDPMFDMDQEEEIFTKEIGVQDSTHANGVEQLLDLASGGEEDADTLGESKPLGKKQLQKQAEALAKHKADKRRRKRLREARANKLEVLKKRQKSILAAANELEMQRAKMARTIGGSNKNGVKFKIRERKR